MRVCMHTRIEFERRQFCVSEIVVFQSEMKRNYSTRIKMEIDCFERDQIVFVKLKRWPPWPSKILDIKGAKYSIFYYGTNET